MMEVLRHVLGFPRKKSFFGKGFLAFRYARKKLEIQERLVKLLDTGIYVVCVASPLSTLPQIWHIFMTQDTAGLSLVTWSAYLVLTFFWLAYGYIHKDTPIIVAQLFWVMIYSGAVVGIALYS